MRRAKPQATRARQAGDLQLPGLHVHLRQIPGREIPDQTQDPPGPHEGEAAGDQGGAISAHALADPRAGEMAGSCRERLLQLPRGADELSCTRAVPRRDHSPLAASPESPQPEGGGLLGSDDRDSRRVSSTTAYPPSLARAAIRRSTPEVRAVCGKAARTDLCGGREVTRVPTATDRIIADRGTHFIDRAIRATGG